MIKTLDLKAEMLKRGITNDKMANALNISHTTMNLKINNKREFKQSEIKKIKKYLDLSPEELVNIFFT